MAPLRQPKPSRPPFSTRDDVHSFVNPQRTRPVTLAEAIEAPGRRAHFYLDPLPVLQQRMDRFPFVRRALFASSLPPPERCCFSRRILCSPFTLRTSLPENATAVPARQSRLGSDRVRERVWSVGWHGAAVGRTAEGSTRPSRLGGGRRPWRRLANVPEACKGPKSLSRWGPVQGGQPVSAHWHREGSTDRQTSIVS